MLKNDIKKIRTSRFHENVLIFIKDKIYLKSIYLSYVIFFFAANNMFHKIINIILILILIGSSNLSVKFYHFFLYIRIVKILHIV